VRDAADPGILSGMSDGLYLHGTKADLSVGDPIAPGYESNLGSRRRANHVYFTATVDAAVWGAELAAGEGDGRIYVVEPTGSFEDDPNLTDKRFPGNPTRSYRSRQPVLVVGELVGWHHHPDEVLDAMRQSVRELHARGVEAIDD